jgi:hypothetical protein
MANHSKNMVRALAILAKDPDESDIAYKDGQIIVLGHCFCLLNVDDREVLEILMAHREFGFAVTNMEDVAKELRAMQSVWIDAAETLKPAA